MRYKMEAFITNLQGKIIKKLQELETEQKFIVDKWERKEGGGGKLIRFYEFLIIFNKILS